MSKFKKYDIVKVINTNNPDPNIGHLATKVNSYLRECNKDCIGQIAIIRNVSSTANSYEIDYLSDFKGKTAWFGDNDFVLIEQPLKQYLRK